MSIRYSNGGREEVENFINKENNHFFCDREIYEADCDVTATEYQI